MNLTTKIIVSLVFYLLVAVGASLIVKANIGMDAFYAFTNSLSAITAIKVGTLVATINITFVIIYAILSKGKYLLVYVIQIVSIIIFGSVVNLLLYNVFSHFELTSYMVRVIILILGVSISAIAIGVVTVLHVITFPVEATCYQLEKNHVMSFVKARYGIDVILFVASSLLSFIFSKDYFIREGTLIALVLFSFLLNISKSFMIKKFGTFQ